MALTIRVPATSANLGPGFDSLGLALGLYNRFEVEPSPRLVLEGCPDELATEDNLFIKAFRRGLGAAGLPMRPVRVRFMAEIPIARGLGSSSACIVGGLLAAQVLARDEGRAAPLDTQSLLDLASELEGHPDNTTPALLGGFAVATVRDGRVEHIRTDIDGELAFMAMIPPFPLETAKARAALPTSIPFKDAAANAGRAALTAAAFLSGEYGKLSEGCRDRLHEPYRAPLIPGFEAIVRTAREAGALAVFLSGAGPTIMAICREEESAFGSAMAPILETQPLGAWRLLSLRADNAGARVD